MALSQSDARDIGLSVKAVDLTEFDPSLDPGDVSSLTAGRWFCEILAGFAAR